MATGDKNTADKKDAKNQGSEGESAAPVNNGGKKKLFVIIGAVVGLLVIVAIVLAVVLSGGKKQKTVEEDVEINTTEEHATNTGDVTADELEENEEPIGAIYPLESFIVNLKGGRFLRAQIQLEFVERDITPRFFARQVIVRDGLTTLLSSKAPEDIETPESKDKLKMEIKDLVNEALKKQEVKKVYFTQFVVQ